MLLQYMSALQVLQESKYMYDLSTLRYTRVIHIAERHSTSSSLAGKAHHPPVCVRGVRKDTCRKSDRRSLGRTSFVRDRYTVERRERSVPRNVVQLAWECT